MPERSPDTLEWCIGPPLQSSFKRILIEEGRLATSEEIEKAVQLYRERFSDLGIFENLVYPGVTEMLHALRTSSKKRLKLHLATSKPQVFAKRILDHHGLTEFFDSVYGSELDGTRSRKGDLIHYVIKEESLLAENCLMIGDREHDVIGARENFMPCIGVTFGYGSREELTGAGAIKLCDSPKELLQVLLG